MSARRGVLSLTLCGLCLPARAVAQQPEATPPWDFTYTPYGYYSAIDGWWLAGYVRY